MINIRDSKKFQYEDNLYRVTYEDIIDTFEYETVLYKNVGTFRGDIYMIMKDKERYGYFEFGWGSCSGCDALLACNSYEDFEKLQEFLFHSIKWFENLKELKEYFKTHYWEGDWTWREEDHKEFRKEVLNLSE